MQLQNTHPPATVGLLALPFLPMLAHAAVPAAAAAQIYAAPAQFSAASPGLGVVRTVLALALVLATVFAAAAAMRRLRMLSGARALNLEVVSQISLGARERAVLLRAGRQQLLIGVAPGNVRLLCQLPESAPEAAAATPEAAPAAATAAPPSFRELLRRSLGR